MNNKITKRSNETKQNLINRLNRISGQVNGIISMINNDRYCVDVITQLSAAINSLKSVSGIILENHIKTCLKNNKNDFDEKLNELIVLIKKV